MIITIKNLQQQTFTMEFDEKNTVLELKTKIFKERLPEYDVDRQQLIYAGVILCDERSLISYNIDEKKFIVVMLKRDIGSSKLQRGDENQPQTLLKCQNNDTSSSSTDEGKKFSCEHENDRIESINAERELPEVTTNESSINNMPTIQHSNENTTLASNEEYRKSVESMIEMGYAKEMVERAMVASFNNVERAVEYLVNGIPESVNTLICNRVPIDLESQNSTDATLNIDSEITNSRNSTNDPFEFLRSQPAFLQMRGLVSENPDLLNAVLQQIAQTNPALLKLISENQDAFLNMLNRSDNDISGSNTNLSSGDSLDIRQGNNMINTSEESRNASESETVPTIRLTSHDRDAIERLKAMGFPEMLVVQAYIACDKDEQLAADFLVTTSFDD